MTSHAFFRAAALAITGVLASATLYLECYRPYVCNVTERKAEARLRSLLAMSDEAMRARSAVQVQQELLHCISVCPERVNKYMLLAVAYRSVGRSADAVRMYETASLYDRRPEIYFNLGIELLELGERRRALDALISTQLFVVSPEKIVDVDVAAVRFDVENAVDAFHRGEQPYLARQVMARLEAGRSTSAQQ